MIRTLSISILVAACGTPHATDRDAAPPDATDPPLTPASCPAQIGAAVPEPYRSLFRCATLDVTDQTLAITISGLPPHPSYYYPGSSPNHEDWPSRGDAYHPNPNTLVTHPTTFAIPLAPVSRGIAITASMVDGVNDAPALEYPQGPVGVALDSVFLFDALAAPGDDIARERYTFDEWNAHPTPDGFYHYHGDAPGPLAIAPTGVQAYGLMCDGTFVLGCTELDGSTPTQSDLDAQNGHVGDVGPIAARYHVHLCTAWPDHPRPYTPEVQYYRDCRVR